MNMTLSDVASLNADIIVPGSMTHVIMHTDCPEVAEVIAASGEPVRRGFFVVAFSHLDHSSDTDSGIAEALELLSSGEDGEIVFETDSFDSAFDRANELNSDGADL